MVLTIFFRWKFFNITPNSLCKECKFGGCTKRIKNSDIFLIFGPRSLSSAVTEVRTENANSRCIEADAWRAEDGLKMASSTATGATIFHREPQSKVSFLNRSFLNRDEFFLHLVHLSFWRLFKILSQILIQVIGAFWPFSWTEVKKQRVMFRSNTYHTDKTLMKTSSLSFYLSFHFIRKMTSGNCAHCIFLSHRRPYFRSW